MSPHSPSRLTIARIVTLAVGLCVMLLAVACSTGSDLAATPSPTSGAPRSTPPPLEQTESGDPGRAVPDVLRFAAPRLSGGTIDGEDLSGQDVAFWFWAPW